MHSMPLFPTNHQQVIALALNRRLARSKRNPKPREGSTEVYVYIVNTICKSASYSECVYI